MPGVNWLVRNIVGTSPFHHRGGIARSNFYHHGMNFLSLPSGRKSQNCCHWPSLTNIKKTRFASSVSITCAASDGCCGTYKQRTRASNLGCWR